MEGFNLNSLNSALETSEEIPTGVDFSGKSLKLDSAKDAQPIVDAINSCPNLQYLTLTGNTLGVNAAQAISTALAQHPELKICRFSDMFTGRMKTEIPPALSALGEGMIAAGARLSVLDLSDNAFGPIGVEGLAKLLESDVCSELEELRLNNNGLGITGGKLLARALGSRPRRLKTFIAGRNRLENEGATQLASVFSNMTTLEEVAMPQNGIYHPGVCALSAAFRRNPGLRRLNLNDNTVTHRGAAAIARAIPDLPNLKSINFGDCLLKSKGAMALADAIKDSNLLVESVDLSNNEISHAACMHVVRALCALPASQEMLSRVVLAGNSLGDSAHKESMRQMLGACAELSGDEGSDEEFVTDSEEDEDSQSEAESEAEDSATEDSRDHSTVLELRDVTLDTSIVQEVDSDVSKFLREPSEENLRSLGPNAAEVISTHLQAIKNPPDFISAFVEATLLTCAASDACARHMFRLLSEEGRRRHAMQWVLIDNLLRGLALIKSENKEYKIRWSLCDCYTALANSIDAPFFPPAARDTLRYFISSKLASLPADVRDVIQKHPSLHCTT